MLLGFEFDTVLLNVLSRVVFETEEWSRPSPFPLWMSKKATEELTPI
jgi:hypothetical protein